MENLNPIGGSAMDNDRPEIDYDLFDLDEADWVDTEIDDETGDEYVVVGREISSDGDTTDATDGGDSLNEPDFRDLVGSDGMSADAFDLIKQIEDADFGDGPWTEGGTAPSPATEEDGDADERLANDLKAEANQIASLDDETDKAENDESYGMDADNHEDAVGADGIDDQGAAVVDDEIVDQDYYPADDEPVDDIADDEVEDELEIYDSDLDEPDFDDAYDFIEVPDREAAASEDREIGSMAGLFNVPDESPVSTVDSVEDTGDESDGTDNDEDDGIDWASANAQPRRRGGMRIGKGALIAGGACAAALAVALGLSFGAFGGGQGQAAGDTIEQTAADSQDQGVDTPSDEEPTVVVLEDLTTANLADMMANLNYGGRAVGVDSASVRIEAKDGNIMVTQSGIVEPISGVTGSAMRSSALAMAVDGKTVAGSKPTLVTWVAEDGDGDVKFAVSHEVGSIHYSASSSPTSDSAIDDAEGYAIANDWLSAVKTSIPGLSASKGKALTKPDGTLIEMKNENVVPNDTSLNSENDKGKAESAEKSETEKTSGSASSRKSTSSSSNRPSQSTPSSSASSHQSNASNTSNPERTWVPEKGHYEDVYENVWVDESKVVPETKYVCDRCKREFMSVEDAKAHLEDAEHGERYTEKTANRVIPGGHYVRKKTGQRYVVDIAAHWE